MPTPRMPANETFLIATGNTREGAEMRSGLEQLLDHEDVLPLAVEGAVPLVHAHLAPAEPADHRDAGLVGGEDLADQLVGARRRGFVRECVEQLPADAGPPRVALNVEGRLAHPVVVVVVV